MPTGNDTTETTPVPNDRDIPSVAESTGKAPMYAAVGVGGLAVVSVFWMLLGSSATSPPSGSQTAPPTTVFSSYGTGVEEHLREPASPSNDLAQGEKLGQVNGVPDTVTAPAKQVSPPTPRKPIATASPAWEARQREQQKRRGAPSVVYSAQGAPQRGAPNQDTIATPFDKQINKLEQQLNSGLVGFGEAAPADSRDANLRYADNVYGQGVATAKASPPQDLSYRIMEGKIISVVLESAINSSLPGRVRGIVDKDVYSESGHNILIPRGSRAIGEYNTDINRGQKRVYVIWPRILRPDGVNIELDSPGTDNLGRAGLAGDVNTHFWQRFGSSILLSIIGAGAANNTDTNAQSFNSSDIYRGAMFRSFGDAADRSLQQSINIKDTINLDQGERIKIFVAKDIDFKDAHRVSRR